MDLSKQKLVYIVCGPTASGKSYFAHLLAMTVAGEVINADSMQIYKEIPIITASPPQKYLDELKYHLYNFLPVESQFSVVKYVDSASALVRGLCNQNITPVIVGGTGLYINALINGYSDIPGIDTTIRGELVDLCNNIGQEKFFEKLRILDPIASLKIRPADKYRTLRAFEVIRQTGKSIFEFQHQSNKILLQDFSFKIIFLNPERSFLHNSCDKRLEDIFAGGALDEVERLKQNYPDFKKLSLKAIGISQISSYLDGEISLVDALSCAKIKTKQYAKRQVTWFKHQIQNKIEINYSSDKEFENILPSIHFR